MKQIKYRGYIYWMLMVLGVFIGNLFDKVETGMLLCTLFVVLFEIIGDAISQLTMWVTLNNSTKLLVIKGKRDFIIFYVLLWTGLLPFPTFVEGLRKGIPTISIIEIPLLILLLLNQFRWMNYQVKKWKINNSVTLK